MFLLMDAELREKVQSELDKQMISSSVLLHKFRLIEESSRISGSYQDPFYLPFYYHLGKFISPKTMLEVGIRLGLPTGCFLKSCKTVTKITGFQNKSTEFYSPRLAYSNLRDTTRVPTEIYHGSILDKEFCNKISDGLDLIIISERNKYDVLREMLDVAWQYLNLEGLLVMDHIDSDEASRDAFSSFCKIYNRDSIKFRTRYGVGLVQK